jgi:hypothetical protein
MGFFSFLKYTFIIFEAHLAISCGAPFENHCLRVNKQLNRKCTWHLTCERVKEISGCLTDEEDLDQLGNCQLLNKNPAAWILYYT